MLFVDAINPFSQCVRNAQAYRCGLLGHVATILEFAFSCTFFLVRHARIVRNVGMKADAATLNPTAGV